MPMAAPVVAALIGAASTAAEVGVQLSGAGQPSAPTAAPAAPTTPQGPTTQQTVSAIVPQALSIESMTGGSVSPDYLSTIAPLLAGVGGTSNLNPAMQQVLRQIFGSGGGGSATGSSAPGGSPTSFTPSGLNTNLAPLANSPGVSDFLQKVAGVVT